MLLTYLTRESSILMTSVHDQSMWHTHRTTVSVYHQFTRSEHACIKYLVIIQTVLIWFVASWIKLDQPILICSVWNIRQIQSFIHSWYNNKTIQSSFVAWVAQTWWDKRWNERSTIWYYVGQFHTQCHKASLLPAIPYYPRGYCTMYSRLANANLTSISYDVVEYDESFELVLKLLPGRIAGQQIRFGIEAFQPILSFSVSFDEQLERTCLYSHNDNEWKYGLCSNEWKV